MPLINVPAGSLIIPMDTTYQNNGMWKAYGLVYRLLQNGIPVQWAIALGKPWNGVDFTATAVDFQTNAPVAHQYTGGPFIIDAAFAAAAAPIITAWQAANTTTVHVATAPFQAQVDYTLVDPPRIAVESNNAGIMIGYLNAAGIPDSTGAVWTTSSPDVLNETEIAGGALFDQTTAPCLKRAYDIFLSPHTGSSSFDNPLLQAQMNSWLQLGGHLHATCFSIEAIENQLFFLTSSGINAVNQGNTGTFTVDDPDHPLDQAVATAVANPLPGGSVQTWQRSATVYFPATQPMAHFVENNVIYDLMIAGPYKNGTGAGYISYEGGHQFSTNLPYSNNGEGPYLRFVYNAIMLAEGLPEIDVQVSPTTLPVGVATPVTVNVVNTGGTDANNMSFSITLDASVIPASVVWSIPPTGGAFPTYTWTGLTAPGNSTVITGNMTAMPMAPGTVTFATFTASYNDVQLTPYSINHCTAVNAQAGPIPLVDKVPDPVNTTPNQNVVWTINTGNGAPITAPDTTTLTNVVLTDIIPAGLTFVNAVPAPTTNVLNMDGTRTLTWNLPNIPAATPLGAGPSVTVTVMTPPATTAVYVNTATLTGTDPTGQTQFSATDTATLNVVNQAPTVTITTPLPPGPLTGPVQICWTASDPDNDPLTFDVFYSPNCNGNLIPIATGVVGNCTNWNTAGIDGSNVCITVVASDTELTGQDVEGPFQVDNTPPTVNLLAPPDGSTICGLVPLTAEAFDNFGVASVGYEYSLDGGTTWVGIGTSIAGPPWTQNFETTLLPDGPILVRAIATDTAGLTGTSAPFNYVIDNTPPTAAITAPPNGSEVSGLVVVQGTASDNIALDRVEWMIDGQLQAIQTVPPFNFVWDTTQFIDGPHTFTLTAFDECGNTAVATATFIVDNVPDCAVEVGVDGNLTIPHQKPPAEQLLEPVVQVRVTKTWVISTPVGPKVIIVGVVDVLVKYVADVPDQAVHAFHAEIPWQTFVICPELTPGTPVNVTVFMESIDFRLIDPRTISKFIVFLLGVEEA